MIVLVCCEDGIVVELPSGNRLAINYLGEGDADRILIQSYDSGEGDSPANLELFVTDPDILYAHNDDGASMHCVCVRHHGPTDGGQTAVPTDFLEDEDVTED